MSSLKICTLGAGFVSNHLKYIRLNDRVESKQDIENIIEREKPDILINCIGKTGRPNVDWCNSHKEETAFANTAIPIMLAEACQKHNIHLIHIGSGCIFFGESPTVGGWKETDFANPQSFYSQTKYACDLAIGSMDHVSILRIRMPISDQNNPRNLINKLRGYMKVIDIPNSMTFMDDLVRCIDWVAKNHKTGIYHVVNPEPTSAAKIMREYQFYNPDHNFQLMSESELDQVTLAKRSNCILNGDKLISEGFYMNPTDEALKSCMVKYMNNQFSQEVNPALKSLNAIHNLLKNINNL